VKIAGKSTVIDVGVTQKDMPNFFVEATTVSEGRVHTQVCNIHVPPTKRILNMEVLPSAESFKPGQHAKITVKLTDAEGKPFVGSTVLSIFDKSLEYISGGTNVGNIKEFFWKWQRQTSALSGDESRALVRQPCAAGQNSMEPIGVFGGLVEADAEKNGSAIPRELDSTMLNGGAGGFGGGGSRRWHWAWPWRRLQRRWWLVNRGPAGGDALMAKSPAGGEAGPSMAQPTLRSEFADTALWSAALETNKTASLKLNSTCRRI